MGIDLGGNSRKYFVENDELTWANSHGDRTKLRMMAQAYGTGPFWVIRTEDIPIEQQNSALASQWLYVRGINGSIINKRGEEQRFSAYWFKLLRQTPLSAMRR